MTSVSPSQGEERLRDGTEQLTQWRQGRPSVRGSRIPAALWKEIVQLAAEFSVRYVAKALCLKSQALKRRRGETAAQPAAASPQFVEVTAAIEQAGPVAVEVQRPDGARLRIPYSESTPALARLLQTFLEVRCCCNSPRRAASFSRRRPLMAVKAWMGWPLCVVRSWAIIPWAVPAMSFAIARARHSDSWPTMARAFGAVPSVGPTGVFPGGRPPPPRGCCSRPGS
jgi:hypothetical protein